MRQRGLPQTGFSGVDLVGQSGLEGQYDRQLQGTIGDKVVSVNAAGTVTGTVRQTPAKPGDDLVTSINAAVQHDAETALANAIQRTRAQGNTQATEGAAVVMTTTGRIVAMASYPTYDPSVWAGGISQKEVKARFGTAHSTPVLHRATQGEYHPGPTWKATTPAAAIPAGNSRSGSRGVPA